MLQLAASASDHLLPAGTARAACLVSAGLLPAAEAVSGCCIGVMGAVRSARLGTVGCLTTAIAAGVSHISTFCALGFSSEHPHGLCRESTSTVKLFRNFKEAATLKLSGSAEGLTGGTLLGVRGLEAVTFYSWISGEVGPAANQQQHDIWVVCVPCLGVE